MSLNNIKYLFIIDTILNVITRIHYIDFNMFTLDIKYNILLISANWFIILLKKIIKYNRVN